MSDEPGPSRSSRPRRGRRSLPQTLEEIPERFMTYREAEQSESPPLPRPINMVPTRGSSSFSAQRQFRFPHSSIPESSQTRRSQNMVPTRGSPLFLAQRHARFLSSAVTESPPLRRSQNVIHGGETPQLTAQRQNDSLRDITTILKNFGKEIVFQRTRESFPTANLYYPQVPIDDTQLNHVVVTPGGIDEKKLMNIINHDCEHKVFRRHGYEEAEELEKKTEGLFTKAVHKVTRKAYLKNVILAREEYIWNTKNYGCIPSHSQISHHEWHLTVEGPPGSPYENGVFFGVITFPKIYPFEMPNVRFRTRIFHPEVDEQGYLSLLRLSKVWKDDSTIMELFKFIENTLKCLRELRLNPIDCYQPKIAELILSDYVEFDRIARKFTEMYALEY